MTRRGFTTFLGLGGLLALVPVHSEAQVLTDAQKIAFANMELRGFRDLGIESNLVQRIVYWYNLGNTAQAKEMLKIAYKFDTGKDVSTAADRHSFFHWIDQFSNEDARTLSQ